MKSQFIFACILNSAVVISSLPGKSLEAVSSQQDSSFTSPLEVQEYAREITQNIYQRLENLLSIPPEQQTFENTLRPWNQLKEDLDSNFKRLNALEEGPFLSDAARRSIEDLRLFFGEISRAPGLHEALIGCCQKINHSSASTPFECYVANQFLNNNRGEFAHLRGSVQEKNTNETDFTVLNLKSADYPRGQALDLAKKISSANADVVCVHEISTNDAHDLFHALQEDYAHFLYLDTDSAIFEFSEYRGGTLIASKRNIEKAKFSRFTANSTDFDEGFFDFVIKNGDGPLGHVYVTNFTEDPYKETRVHKFVGLIERMQEDILKMEEELIPFCLCGDFMALQSSEEGKVLVNTYFRSENHRADVHTLLLQSLPAFPREVLSSEYSISTTPVALLGDCTGSLTLFRKEIAYPIDDALKNISGNYWNENCTILCGGQADVSGRRDSGGNASVEAKVSTSTETESGTFSTEVRGSVSQDKDGNTSAEIEASASWRW